MYTGSSQSDGRRARMVPVVVVLAALALPLTGRTQRYVPTTDPEHPRLRYADSLDSVNDRCAVRKNKLNPKVRPVYVNKQPVGFC